MNSTLQADTPSNASIKDFIEFCKNIPMIAGNFSRDVKKEVGITIESDFFDLSYF